MQCSPLVGRGGHLLKEALSSRVPPGVQPASPPADPFRRGSREFSHRAIAHGQPPCRDSNPGHRPMASPTDKVDCRLAQARTGPGEPGVDYTAAPVLSRRGQETCRRCTRLQGVGRLSVGSGMPLPGTGSRPYVRVSSPRLPGEHLSREAAPARVHSSP